MSIRTKLNVVLNNKTKAQMRITLRNNFFCNKLNTIVYLKYVIHVMDNVRILLAQCCIA